MTRCEALRRLIDERYEGKVAAFARAIKRAPSQVSQWLSGHRALGDAGARHIEKTLNLGIGWFDAPYNNHTTAEPTAPAHTATQQRLLDLYSRLPPAQQAAVMTLLEGYTIPIAKPRPLGKQPHPRRERPGDITAETDEGPLPIPAARRRNE